MLKTTGILRFAQNDNVAGPLRMTVLKGYEVAGEHGVAGV
jgi:hypothetical protein